MASRALRWSLAIGAACAAPHRWSESSCTTLPFSEYVARHRPRRGERRTLVTGGAGFIGSHIVEYCASQLGHDVVAVDDLSGGFLSNIDAVIDRGALFVRGDVSNDTFVRELFESRGPFDYVFHLAAYAAEGLSHHIRRHNYENNLVGSVTLLNAALRQHTRSARPIRRFVFTSSIAVHGSTVDASELPMTEETPLRPEDPYGIAKHAFELDLASASAMFGLEYTVFRPHNVFGPRQHAGDRFRNAVGIFMNQVLRDEPITVFGDGEQRRSFSYIDDVAPLIAASVLYPATAGHAFLVGSDGVSSLNALAAQVRFAMGRRRRHAHARHVLTRALPTPQVLLVMGANSSYPVSHLEPRMEVVDAYASHDKARCFFRPPPPKPLQDALAATARYVSSRGPSETTGRMQIEVPARLPPSWKEWLDARSGVAETSDTEECSPT